MIPFVGLSFFFYSLFFLSWITFDRMYYLFIKKIPWLYPINKAKEKIPYLLSVTCTNFSITSKKARHGKVICVVTRFKTLVARVCGIKRMIDQTASYTPDHAPLGILSRFRTVVIITHRNLFTKSCRIDHNFHTGTTWRFVVDGPRNILDLVK